MWIMLQQLQMLTAIIITLKLDMPSNREMLAISAIGWAVTSFRTQYRHGIIKLTNQARRQVLIVEIVPTKIMRISNHIGNASQQDDSINAQIMTYNIKQQMSYKVLGADYCPFCIKVKQYLIAHKIPYQWVDSETSQGASERKQLSAKYNYQTIPMVFIDKEFIGGCQQFFEKIKPKL